VWAFVVPATAKAVAGDDADETAWVKWGHLHPRELAFDHAEVLLAAHARIRELLKVPGGWKLLVPGRQKPTPNWKKRIERAFAHKPTSPKAKPR
jgi:hypothetical protein